MKFIVTTTRGFGRMVLSRYEEKLSSFNCRVEGTDCLVDIDSLSSLKKLQASVGESLILEADSIEIYDDYMES